MLPMSGVPQGYCGSAFCDCCKNPNIHEKPTFFQCGKCRFDYCEDCAPSRQTVREDVENSCGAFVIFNDDECDSVTPEGNAMFGGDAGEKKSDLVDVESVYGTSSAFAALKYSGAVVVWGNPV